MPPGDSPSRRSRLSHAGIALVRFGWWLFAGPRPEYALSRWLFLRGLGIAYLIAFVSLGVQVVGLIGENGILPVGELLDMARDELGGRAVLSFPTLFWLGQGDAALQAACWGGAALSLLLIAGVAPVPVLVVLWMLYLSLTVVGQHFLGFQWDALLLETGLLAVFYAPLNLLPRFSAERYPSTIVRWLLWLLVFKLMFLSGITKIVSQDPTWAGWTALDYHYQTQPLPHALSWYAHQAPDWFQRFSLACMWFAELVAPFLIFVPPKLRYVRYFAGLAMAGLQVMILFTGNYGFFNVLAIVLCLTLVGDDVWRKLLPGRARSWFAEPPQRRPEPLAKRVVAVLLAVAVVPLTTMAFWREIWNTASAAERAPPRPTFIDRTLAAIAPFRSINGYGLFRVMTTTRPEIIFEGSDDGETWLEIPFCYKPRNVYHAPAWAGPHMPRLDWQMWFAALDARDGRFNQQPWMVPFVERLLQGEPDVLALLSESPFPDGPPRYLRLVFYEYEFTTWRADDPRAWWQRERLRDPTPPLSLRRSSP